MINNYKEFKKFLNDIHKNKKKPTLLIHSCCGPCSSHVLSLLNQYFKITIFYYNPNIYPNDEFKKRFKEQQRLIQEMKLDINVIEGLYEYDTYLKNIKGLEKNGERSKRCYNCYELRIMKTFEYAKKYHFDYYTTTLSISPHKNSKWLNEIGEQLCEGKRVKYLPSDFKKKNGYKRSVELSSEYGMYRQDYCGCVYSKVEREEQQRKAELQKKSSV